MTDALPPTIINPVGLAWWFGDNPQVEFEDEPWPDAPGGGWRVELIWCEIDGRQECVGVLVVGDGTRPFTASALRQLAFGTVVTESRRRKIAQSKQALELAERIGRQLPFTQRHIATLTARRRRYDDEHYQAVADAYDEAMRIGIPPTAHVQSELGLNSRTQAAKQVARARERGLLPPTEQRIPKGNQ